ncbi:MAG: ferrous iron transporter B [Candidatus Altiarchaeota archaeon]
MKILLMGNPNVGKSVLFSRLTGVQVMCSNYPGTTVSYCTGHMIYGSRKVELIDVPGTYSLDARNRAEEIASEMLKEGDVIINVVDATNLERNLYLTLELLETGKPMIVALNMWDDTRHLGITVDVKKLEEMLGVPVVPTVAITGEGMKELSERLSEARGPKIKKHSEDERWSDIGLITKEVQTVEHRHHTLWESLEDATIKPIPGIPIAFIVMFLVFSTIVSVGNWVIGHILDPFFYNIYGPFITGTVESFFPSGIVREILIGSGGKFTESLGVLTTAVYVSLDMTLPFVILFYFVLSLLEDIGYLPRLATLADSMMHRIGLHGSAIVPAMLGLGCNVPGALATRIMETRKQRFIAATLMAICIPCIAKNAVILGLLMRFGIKYVAIVYATLAILYVTLGLILNRLIPGESPELLLEIPPYRRPKLQTLVRKTWVRVEYFIKDAIPYVLLGVLAVNILYVLGIVDLFARAFGPFLSTWFGLPNEAVIALIVGFLRKDVAIGMLAPLGLSAMQLVVACTILSIYFPCVATFTVLTKELGIKDMAKAVMLMILVTFTVGGIMRFLLL